MPDDKQFRVVEGGGNVVPVRCRTDVHRADMQGFAAFLEGWVTSIKKEIQADPAYAQKTVSMVAVTEFEGGLYRHHYNGGGTDTIGALTWAAGRYARDLDD